MLRIVNPFTVTPAALVTDSIPEPTGNTAYNAGTTYASGAQVVVSQQSYVSLQAGNVGHSPASSPTWWWPIGPQPWLTGTTYSLNDVVSNAHRTYKCIVGLTSSTAPGSDPTHWTDTGPTPTWAPFDNYATTQATWPTSLDLKVNATGIVDTLYLANLAGAQVEVKMSTVAAGTFYDQTISLAETAGIDTWYNWFFLPTSRKTELALTELPKYASPTVELIISDTSGATVGVGLVVMGQADLVGYVQFSPQLGIVDYSKKTTDANGNVTITPGAFAKRVVLNALLDKDYVDRCSRLLAGYRATPVLYVCDEAYASMAVFGFYKNFTTTIAYPDVSLCALELEGLI